MSVKKARAFHAMEAIKHLLLVKGAGILTGTGIKGFLVYTTNQKEGVTTAICAVLDVVQYFEKEFRDIQIRYETKLEAGHDSLEPNQIVIAHVKSVKVY